MPKSKSDTIEKTGNLNTTWPILPRCLVSCLILFHATAILAGVWASPPASTLQREVAEGFAGYHQAIDQGYSYRYFAPEPPPTPILIAKLYAAGADDDHPLETIRLPERGISPRMRYQRQLAVVRELAVSYDEVRRDPEHRPPFWAATYAQHLGSRRPECVRVKLYLQVHLIPDLNEVRQMLDQRKKSPDLDAPAFYSIPELIGEYPCNRSAS